ncbi:alanine racemase [Actinocrispum wychmicini]|uniref:Diaminopimelate decarboxylase n=1 Tax=Actinocrispum wychmicini TaxID=1213861 RepID=A0A4R2JXI1_9PSEU|nr:alanine racemase [Actinocrispum wychmicini]TCO61889.1 diaminopimelate decarboxylase [Actinocrispum wychmicini]
MSLYEYLADRYPGPVYIYDLDRVVAAITDLREALPDHSRVYYSLKANPHIDIVRELCSAGCLAEVSSSGELDSALAAGHSGEDCLYTGPGKTDAEIAYALRRGVGLVSVESVAELRRLDRLAAAQQGPAGVLLRVNAHREAGSGGIHMTGSASQFGIHFDQIGEAVAVAQDCPSIDVRGLHLFSMSNAQDEDSLIKELESNIATARRIQDTFGLRVRLVDLGGGFAAPYTQAQTRPSYPALREALRRQLDQHLPGWRSGVPEVAFESGRYLVGDSGSLMCTVTDVKTSNDTCFVVLDTGVNVLGGLSGIGRLLPLSVHPLAPFPSADANEIRATLVGPLCTPADVLGRNVDLPAVRPGDRLVIPNVGAYGLTASLLGFLSRPTPCEIVLRHGKIVSESRLELVRVPAGKESAR